MISKNTYQYPFLVSVINKFVHGQEAAKNFEWTSICINGSWQSARHRDTNNVGESLIFSVGRHTGGRLRIWPEDSGKEHVGTLSQKGSKTIDPKHNPTIFNGKQCHSTEPFTGQRVSIICFKSRWIGRCSRQVTSELKYFLFPCVRSQAFVGFKDPNCRACQGSHRRHTCGKDGEKKNPMYDLAPDETAATPARGDSQSRASSGMAIHWQS